MLHASTVGGGLRNLEDIRLMLNAGADKVSLNTSAVLDPKTLKSFILETSVLSLRLMLAALLTKVKVPHGGRRATGIDAVVGLKVVQLGQEKFSLVWTVMASRKV